MGTDYTARAIIGFMLPSEDDLPKATKLVRKKAFKHHFYDDGEHEYHPKDGRKLWLDEKEEVPTNYPAIVFDLDNCDMDCEPGQKVIKAPKGLEFAIGTDSNSICLGFVVETGSSNGGEDLVFGKLPDINTIKEKIKKVLEPVGLWNEDDFGLYSQLHCSY